MAPSYRQTSYATSTRKFSAYGQNGRAVLITRCSDGKCQEPLYIGMEDPGTCSFSDPDVDIANKTVSVHCYDSNSIYDQRAGL